MRGFYRLGKPPLYTAPSRHAQKNTWGGIHDTNNTTSATLRTANKSPATEGRAMCYQTRIDTMRLMVVEKMRDEEEADASQQY